MDMSIFADSSEGWKIQFPYNPELIRAVKSTKKARWNPQEKVWYVPSDQQTVNTLLNGLYTTGLFTYEPSQSVPDIESVCTKLSREIASRHLSPRTNEAYVQWVEKFSHFIQPVTLEDGATKINSFLSFLAVQKNVSASTQNQALAALLFLYRHVFKIDSIQLGESIRSKRSQVIPVVLSQDEVQRLFRSLEGDILLIARLLYGTGMRLGEALNLRIGDLDFGDVLVRQEQLLESERTPIGEEDGAKTWAVGCSSITEDFTAGGGTASGYGSGSFLFKSAGKGTRIVYFYMPNLTLQEAAALGTKINGPFPNTVVGDEGVVNETAVGTAPTNIDGANVWFTDNGNGTYDAWAYVSHQ